jgi:hypothetical protein
MSRHPRVGTRVIHAEVQEESKKMDSKITTAKLKSAVYLPWDQVTSNKINATDQIVIEGFEAGWIAIRHLEKQQFVLAEAEWVAGTGNPYEIIEATYPAVTEPTTKVKK